MPQKSSARHGDHAEEMAITALSFLASEPERLGRFLSLTGLGPHNLRQSAREPVFLGQVLAYLCSDEALLLAFAQSAGLAPDAVAKAHAQLAGPAAEAAN